MYIHIPQFCVGAVRCPYPKPQTPNPKPRYFMRFSFVNLYVFPTETYGFPMFFLCKSYVFPMETYGFPMDFLCSSLVKPMSSL